MINTVPQKVIGDGQGGVERFEEESVIINVIGVGILANFFELWDANIRGGKQPFFESVNVKLTSAAYQLLSLLSRMLARPQSWSYYCGTLQCFNTDPINHK